MNGSQAQAVHAPADDITLKRMGGRLLGEAAGSIAVIALTIAGLAGFWQADLAAIATIVLAAAILIGDGLFGRAATVTTADELLTTDFLAGVSNIVLGILALLNIVPDTLLSVSVIVFGGVMIFGHLTEANFGSQMLVGVAALALGIVAICGVHSLILVLVALLVLGGMEFFAGAANGVRIARGTRHLA